MLRNIALLAFLLQLITSAALAQTGPVEKKYFDADRKPTDSLNAHFTQITTFHSFERKRATIEYYRNPSHLITRYEVLFQEPGKPVEDGPCTTYHDNGQLNATMTYSLDKLDGSLKSYYPSGQQRREDLYKDGELVTGKCFSTTGQDTAYFAFEKTPEYPGGLTGMMNFISKNFRYPKQALRKGEQGRVLVRFIIEKDGTVSNVGIEQSVSELLDEEAMRVVNLLSGFTPAEQEGVKVTYRYVLPIRFKLQ